MMTTQCSGSCLCGKVKLSVALTKNSLSACHCSMCRKWNGGPLMALHHEGDIVLTGEENITYYDSSLWGERAFCQACGTHLFYHMKGTKQYNIAAWLLDNVKEPTFELQIYIDKKPTCYSFAEKTAEMTEADIIELFAGK